MSKSKNKLFQFEIEMTSTALGVVSAKDKESAIKKIKKQQWDDIYNTIDETYGELISIDEGNEE
jgi:hypothetical protein